MSKFFTPEQLRDLATNHSCRVIDNMSKDGLRAYAIQMMFMSFSQTPGCGNLDEEMLLSDIYETESEDLDSVAEFLTGAGIDTATVDNIVNNYQF